MTLSVLVFVLVNCLLVRLPTVPGPEVLSLAVPVAVYSLALPRIRWLGALLLSVWLTVLSVQQEQALRLSAHVTEARVTGEVLGLPVHADGISRFQFQVKAGGLSGRQFRLSWYRPDRLPQGGDRCDLVVRLRPPSGSVNPGIFDYEQWLYLKRIHGTGYVREVLQCQAPSGFSLPRVREHLRSVMAQVAGPGQLNTFLALALGDTGALDAGQWEILNQTGTTHLLIVSGLHVGFIAGLIYSLGGWCGLTPGFRALVTIFVTGCYAAVSGWGLPVQRAFVMLCIVLLIRQCFRNGLWLTQWLVALLVVLIVDPLASLGNGFWLSFGAVLVLMACFDGEIATRKGIRRVIAAGVRSQWIVCLGLLPLLAISAGALPLGAFLVNLVAIPWVGMLLVPVLFVAVVFIGVAPGLSAFLLGVAGFLSELLWTFLTANAKWNLVWPVLLPSPTAFLSACAGVALLIVPWTRGCRWLGVLLIAGLLVRPSPLPRGMLRVTFLDVGQGLSVIVESSGQTLLYDTGPAFGERFSAAKQIVLPVLRRRGVSGIDTFVISHWDNDHAGGRRVIRSGLPVFQEITPSDCEHRWQADGFQWHTFKVLDGGDTNDSSCLLLATGDQFTLLLTGDIETAGEQALLARGVSPVTVMSVPHHGSDSSSTPALLNALRPDIAVVSAGYLGRFGHPDPQVLARYMTRHVRILNTAEHGAVTIFAGSAGVNLETARDKMAAIWRR